MGQALWCIEHHTVSWDAPPLPQASTALTAPVLCLAWKHLDRIMFKKGSQITIDRDSDATACVTGR